MTEPTREFEKEAFRAAGPVFLVAIGVLLLAMLGVLLLLGRLPAPIGAAFGVGGILALVAGLALGSARSDRPKMRRVRV